MKKLVTILSLLVFCITCGNNPANEAGPCGRPSIHSCSGDPCTYSHIFDEDGNLINEGASSGGSFVYWNGCDCRGDSVPCGKYTVKTYLTAFGQTTMRSQEVLVLGEQSTSATERDACDSLAQNCTGHYVEVFGATLNSSGHITEDVQCLCCE